MPFLHASVELFIFRVPLTVVQFCHPGSRNSRHLQTASYIKFLVLNSRDISSHQSMWRWSWTRSTNTPQGLHRKSVWRSIMPEGEGWKESEAATSASSSSWLPAQALSPSPSWILLEAGSHLLSMVSGLWLLHGPLCSKWMLTVAQGTGSLERTFRN